MGDHGRRNAKKPPDTSQDTPLMTLFRVYSKALDEKNDKYERIYKTSRDVTVRSKRVIFSLQRIPGWEWRNRQRKVYLKCFTELLIVIIIVYNCCEFCSRLGFVYFLFFPDIGHLSIFFFISIYRIFSYGNISKENAWILQPEWRGEGSIDGISYKWTAWHWAYTPKAYCHGT